MKKFKKAHVKLITEGVYFERKFNGENYMFTFQTTQELNRRVMFLCFTPKNSFGYADRLYLTADKTVAGGYCYRPPWVIAKIKAVLIELYECYHHFLALQLFSNGVTSGDVADKLGVFNGDMYPYGLLGCELMELYNQIIIYEKLAAQGEIHTTKYIVREGSFE